MNRRDLLKAAALTPAAAAPQTGSAGRAEIVRLKLRDTWTTVMSSSDFRDNLHVALTYGGITGRGEGAPIPRYKESAKTALAAFEQLRPLLTSADPWQFDKLQREIARRIQGEYAAKAAIDMALLDWAGQKLGIPLYRYFGFDPKDAPVTTFSIGIDKPDVVKRKVREAEAFPVLKIKVGLKTDEEMIDAVRSVTKKPLRVDANEGWTDKDEAVAKINWLEKQGVEFVEQPMPAHMLEEMNYVRKRVHLPILADEAAHHPSDVAKLAPYFDGINVKLMKTGGVLEAYRMLQLARSMGLKTMIGCMIESSISITAAAHLSPLVDYADLDGNLLIANDPYVGVKVEQGRLMLPGGPGLGLVVRAN